MINNNNNAAATVFILIMGSKSKFKEKLSPPGATPIIQKPTDHIKSESITYFKKYMKIASSIHFRQWTEANDPREREPLIQDIRRLVSQLPKPIIIESLKDVIMSYGDASIDEIIKEDDMKIPKFSKIEPLISYFLFFGVPRRQLQLNVVVKLRELISFSPIFDKTLYYEWKMFMLNNSHYLSCEPTPSILNLIIIAGYFNPLKIQSRLLDLQYNEELINDLSLERLVTKIEGYILNEFVDFLVDDESIDTYRPLMLPMAPVRPPPPHLHPHPTTLAMVPNSKSNQSDISHQSPPLDEEEETQPGETDCKKELTSAGDKINNTLEKSNPIENVNKTPVQPVTPTIRTPIYREASTQTSRYVHTSTQTDEPIPKPKIPKSNKQRPFKSFAESFNEAPPKTNKLSTLDFSSRMDKNISSDVQDMFPSSNSGKFTKYKVLPPNPKQPLSLKLMSQLQKTQPSTSPSINNFGQKSADPQLTLSPPKGTSSINSTPTTTNKSNITNPKPTTTHEVNTNDPKNNINASPPSPESLRLASVSSDKTIPSKRPLEEPSSSLSSLSSSSPSSSQFLKIERSLVEKLEKPKVTAFNHPKRNQIKEILSMNRKAKGYIVKVRFEDDDTEWFRYFEMKKLAPKMIDEFCLKTGLFPKND